MTSQLVTLTIIRGREERRDDSQLHEEAKGGMRKLALGGHQLRPRTAKPTQPSTGGL